MTGAFVYLAVRSARNRLARQLDRLRTPRYAIALVLGLGYLWLIGVRQRPQGLPSTIGGDTIELLAAAGVAAVVAWSWVFGAERSALAFSPAEVTHLFSAPIHRWELIRFKLLRSQFVILFNVVLWTLLLSAGRAASASGARSIAIWVLLTTLSLHRLGASLARTSLWQHGKSGIRRGAATLVALGIVAAVIGLTVAEAVPAARAAGDAGVRELLAALREVASRPLPSALLFPFRLAVRPLLSESWSEWGRAIGPAAAMLGLHYVWVIRSDAAFEESAAAAALARHRVGGSLRAGRGGKSVRWRGVPTPPLGARGWPAGALLWKNVVALLRTGRSRTPALAYAAAIVLIGVLWLWRSVTGLEIIGWLTAMWAGFLLLLGPQWVRNDLRGDLPRLALLRSYPLRGREVVAAETAASTVVLTAVQLGLLALAQLALTAAAVAEPPANVRSAGLIAAVILLPAVNFLGMLILNGATLLLPEWVTIGPRRRGGVEALGQNMLVISGYLIGLGGLLLLPVAAGGAVFIALRPALGLWAVAPAGIVGLSLAAVEAGLLVGCIGRLFEVTDPASVPPAEVW